MDIEIARTLLTRVGWLSRQPEAFQETVLAGLVLRHYAAGDTIYRLGGAIGGVYGLVSGSVIVTTAPPHASPRLFHYATTGSWIGEGPFLSREPRRVGLAAVLDTWMAYLPLETMDQIAAEDPSATRRFAQILLINTDILVRAFCDIQNPDESRRIAATLCRIGGGNGIPIPLTQSELGLMSNSPRKQVNSALKRFSEKGWISKSYRKVVLRDIAGLHAYAASGEGG